MTQLLEELYAASAKLEDIFPGRKFTLDGHLVGSIGEVIAAYMFDLKLAPASNQGHDAVAPDGRQVEVKLTQRTSVAMRHEPKHLVALHRPKGGPVRVIFNGPGKAAWDAAGKMQKNGQRSIGIARLTLLNKTIDESQRLKLLRTAPV